MPDLIIKLILLLIIFPLWIQRNKYFLPMYFELPSYGEKATSQQESNGILIT